MAEGAASLKMKKLDLVAEEELRAGVIATPQHDVFEVAQLVKQEQRMVHMPSS